MIRLALRRLLLLAAWSAVLLLLTRPLIRNTDNVTINNKHEDAQVDGQSCYIFVCTENSLLSTAVLQTHSAAKLSPGPGPAPEYEAYRRRAAGDVQELWLYARARLGSLQQEGGGGAQASAPKSSI